MKGKFIIANWKMNPETLNEAIDLFEEIKKNITSLKKTKIIICPSFLHLGDLTALYNGKKISFGAQNSFWLGKGSFTGEVSPTMLADLGVQYVILGHSERRNLGETNEMVNKKILKALNTKLKIILCIGEKERDNQGQYLSFLREEIERSLKGVSGKNLKNIIIAYEPIWAIGKSGDKAMEPRQIHQIKIFILKTLKEIFGSQALKTEILYGGSSSPLNAEKILNDGQADGLLVGHQSLIAKNFIEISKIAEKL